MMKKLAWLFSISFIFICCSKNDQDIESSSIARFNISSTQAYQYYLPLIAAESPYTFMMNKYLDMALEYLYGWDDMYPQMDLDTKKTMIDSYANTNPDLDETELCTTDFDEFFNQLNDSLVAELNSFPYVQDKIRESIDSFEVDSSTIDYNDMIVTLAGIGYSKMDLLWYAENHVLLKHESFNDEDEIANTYCDCGCEPTYAPAMEATSPRYLNRYFLLSLWLTDIRYRNFKNSCPDMVYMREAMNEWEEASNHAIHFREIQDNGWNRFTWGIGCNYHVKLSDTSDPNISGSSSLGAVPWAHIYISQNAPYGTYLHELGHTLGLLHEHTRPDRDCYIDIDWEQIKCGYKLNFHKYLCTSVQMFGEFDFESIMMYGSYAFSKSNQPTMVKKDGTTFYAQREQLSENDIQYIQYLYHN